MKISEVFKMRYYISDPHFFHENLNLGMDCRGFINHEVMNEYMIMKWNKKVRKHDEVVILGDLSIAKGKDTNEILRRLNKKLYMIVGNHDKFLKDKEFDTTRFRWIKDYAELNENNRKVILSHYPIMFYKGQYRRDADGNPKVFMLYGHIHNTKDQRLMEKFIAETSVEVSESKGRETDEWIDLNKVSELCPKCETEVRIGKYGK